MQNLFEPSTATGIIERLNRIEADAKPNWGKMNAAQMVTHCQAPFRVYFGELKLKQALIGILFGRMAKKKLFTDSPWKKSLPTAREFVVADDRDFQKERESLIGLIRRFVADGGKATPATHPFFGKMTAEEWAMLGYKHLDHHLKQFGV